MIFEVLEDFQAAPDRSRPGGSIGDVKFEIRSDQTSQNRPQSVDLPGGKPEKYMKKVTRGPEIPPGGASKADASAKIGRFLMYP